MGTKLYLAPLQGLTDWVFREAYNKHIGLFDKSFSPFIRVQDGDFFRPSQCKDILPENNSTQTPVPQFLGNESASFFVFEELCVKHGYTEVNINLGCPFVKVTGKGLGAGLLSQPEIVERLLHEVFERTKLNISVKCRLGLHDTAEFEKLIPIFNRHPLSEIIIHPRLGTQLYKGDLHLDALARYSPHLHPPLCFNGDITSADSIARVKELVPGINRFMIGRGVIHNPFILPEIKGISIPLEQKKNMLRGFHLNILELCKKKYSGQLSELKRFEEMWEFHASAFHDGHKLYKQVKKCNSLAKYESIVMNAILDNVL